MAHSECTQVLLRLRDTLGSCGVMRAQNGDDSLSTQKGNKNTKLES